MALIGLNVGVWAVFQRAARTTTVTMIPRREPTPTPTPATQLVPFVPVTAFKNFEYLDTNDISGSINVAHKYYLPIAGDEKLNEKTISIDEVSDDDYAAFLKEPTNAVYLIPLGELNSGLRVLNVNDKSVFDSNDNDWELMLPVSSDLLPTAINLNEVKEFVFGGTVVLSRGVAERIEKYNAVEYPWSAISQTLSSADYAFINFKGSITSNCVYDGYTLSFCGQPDYVEGMKLAGVDGVSVSGNHIGDYGQSGMKETIQFLEKNEIEHTGLGKKYPQAFEPLVANIQSDERDPYSVVMVAYNNVFGTAPCASEKDQWGVTCLLDQEKLSKEIADLKAKYDVVIAYPNWGPEYTHYPDPEKQIKWGRLMADAGADLVVGDQAHWVQTMEIYNETPIFYGVGNLVFDQMWSEKTREGILLRVFLYDGQIISIEPVATKIYDYAQPRIETGSTGKAILDYLSLPLDAAGS
ncbi:CapA family protein [candidate division WWE3 bacterium]|uniref:CapA family protein n=1 Tax=candidate division WWE3 bacterium TaxID=2053526 RepID=A0A955LHB5_UNCKA|nr:CapA family protein [candidate division WWE3 bacterium]